MRLRFNEEFRSLLEQLSYIDHEKGTHVVLELTEVIAHARAEDLTINEIVHLVQSRADTLTFKKLIVPGEQEDLVKQLIRDLRTALAEV
jgi:hypothetical protein